MIGLAAATMGLGSEAVQHLEVNIAFPLAVVLYNNLVAWPVLTFGFQLIFFEGKSFSESTLRMSFWCFSLDAVLCIAENYSPSLELLHRPGQSRPVLRL